MRSTSWRSGTLRADHCLNRDGVKRCSRNTMIRAGRLRAPSAPDGRALEAA